MMRIYSYLTDTTHTYSRVRVYFYMSIKFIVAWVCAECINPVRLCAALLRAKAKLNLAIEAKCV